MKKALIYLAVAASLLFSCAAADSAQTAQTLFAHLHTESAIEIPVFTGESLSSALSR